MNKVIDQILDTINSATNEPDFLDVLFGDAKHEAITTGSIVLFGAGSLGQELCLALNNHGVFPRCFCDSDDTKHGTTVCDIPVIGIDELHNTYRNSYVLLATKKHTKSFKSLLNEAGFQVDRLLCAEPNTTTYLAFLYSIAITQIHLSDWKRIFRQGEVLEKLVSDKSKIQDAYAILGDKKSQELLIAKLALLASGCNFHLFGKFITMFSEPFQEFGFDNHLAHPEDYYYFNNDVLTLDRDEVYVDVGAFDGDTVRAFIDACENNRLEYRHILAFEPDPQCYELLRENTRTCKNVSCHQLGIWSERGTLRFASSDVSVHDQSAAICRTGDIDVQVVPLDDILQGEEVTFIKMDTGGNVIPDAIKGAASTIKTFRPKLALAAYHGIEGIYEIPLLVKSICPDYRLYLRHNTYHMCDTDLYAVV